MVFATEHQFQRMIRSSRQKSKRGLIEMAIGNNQLGNIGPIFILLFTASIFLTQRPITMSLPVPGGGSRPSISCQTAHLPHPLCSDPEARHLSARRLQQPSIVGTKGRLDRGAVIRHTISHRSAALGVRPFLVPLTLTGSRETELA